MLCCRYSHTKSPATRNTVSVPTHYLVLPSRAPCTRNMAQIVVWRGGQRHFEERKCASLMWGTPSRIHNCFRTRTNCNLTYTRAHSRLPDCVSVWVVGILRTQGFIKRNNALKSHKTTSQEEQEHMHTMQTKIRTSKTLFFKSDTLGT